MSEDKLYELRQDIWTPVYFIRAGFRKTEKEWVERLGKFNIKFASEWFIDLSKEINDPYKDDLQDLINSIFEKRNLNSISYKEAAREIAELWLKQNQKP
jgi:hypothetical protein